MSKTKEDQLWSLITGNKPDILLSLFFSSERKQFFLNHEFMDLIKCNISSWERVDGKIFKYLKHLRPTYSCFISFWRFLASPVLVAHWISQRRGSGSLDLPGCLPESHCMSYAHQYQWLSTRNTLSFKGSPLWRCKEKDDLRWRFLKDVKS